MKLLSRFVDETTIGGFNEIQQYRGCAKCCWITLLSFALVLTIGTIWKSIALYMLNMTTTSLKTYTDRHFPAVAVCLGDSWIDNERLHAAGFNKHDKAVINNIIGFKPVKPSLVREFLAKTGNRSILEIAEVISRNPEGLVAMGSTLSAQPMNVTKFYTNDMVCYKSPEGSGQENDFLLMSGEMYVWVNSQMLPTRKFVELRMDRYPLGPMGEPSIVLKHGKMYKVTAQPVRISGLPGYGKACANYGKTDFQKCILDEINDKCRSLGRKQLVNPFKRQMPKDLGQYFHPKVGCLSNLTFFFGSLARSIESRCQPPCESFIYSFDAYEQSHLQNSTFVLIDVLRPFDVWQIEDQYEYDFFSLLGDLGGQVSLYTGASLISVVHLVYFFVNACASDVLGRAS